MINKEKMEFCLSELTGDKKYISVGLNNNIINNIIDSSQRGN